RKSLCPDALDRRAPTRRTFGPVAPGSSALEIATGQRAFGGTRAQRPRSPAARLASRGGCGFGADPAAVFRLFARRPAGSAGRNRAARPEEQTSELQSLAYIVC